MKRALLGLLVLLVAAAVVFRATLPSRILRKVNAALGSLDGYKGRAEDVDLSLLRGRITLKGLVVSDTKDDFKLEVPRLTADVSYRALLHKDLVAEVWAREPSISLVASKPSAAAKKAGEKARKAEASVEKKTGKTVAEQLRALMPFRVRAGTLSGGSVVLKLLESPEQPVTVSDARGRVEGLTNTSRSDQGKASLDAKLAGGTLSCRVTFDPMAKQPTFDLKAEASDLELPQLSPLLRSEWNVDVKRGVLALVAEARAEGGGFKGYVKPFVKDLEAAHPKSASVGKKVKAAVVNAVAKILENKKTKEVAAKVEFSGRFDDPKTDFWSAVATVLRNAFEKALSPSFESLR